MPPPLIKKGDEMEYKVGDIVKITNEKGLYYRNKMIKIGRIGKNGLGCPIAMVERPILFLVWKNFLVKH